MRPRDPWVQERLAAFYRDTDDSAAAAPYVRAVAMPDRWLMNTRVKIDQSQTSDLPAHLPLKQGRSIDSLWAHNKEKLGQWRWIHAQKSGGAVHGAILRLTREHGWRKGDDHTVLCTQFTAERAMDLYMAVTLGSRYRAFLNGRLVGETATRRTSAFDLRDIYPLQRANFDADYHRVHVRAGTNRVVLVFSNQWYPDVWSKTIRCSFVDTECRTPGFDGQRLVIPEEKIEGRS
jgi:hypothetical protein